MLVLLIDYYYLVLNVILQHLYDLFSYFRVVFLCCLDCHHQLRLVEVDPRLVRIDSGILKQNLVELILVGFKVLVKVVPLFVVHFLGNFNILIDVVIIILVLLTIIFFNWMLMLLGFLHHGWEDYEGPLFYVVKEELELISHCLKLQFVLFQALKHDGFDIIVRIVPGNI